MAFIKSCSIDSRTKLTSEISCPTDSRLAQLVKHWPEDLEVLVSIQTGGNFWQNLFCSSLYKDLSDNLTEMPIVKNSNNRKGYSDQQNKDWGEGGDSCCYWLQNIKFSPEAWNLIIAETTFWCGLLACWFYLKGWRCGLFFGAYKYLLIN